MLGFNGFVMGLVCLIGPTALEHYGGHDFLKFVTMALPFWTIYFSWDTIGFLPGEPFTSAYNRHAKWVQGLLLGAYICLPIHLVLVVTLWALGKVGGTLMAIVVAQALLGVLIIQYRGDDNGALVPELRPR